MALELLDILTLTFGILSLFFFAMSVVIWFGLNIFHDISVLTGLGAKRAIRKMKKEVGNKTPADSFGRKTGKISNTYHKPKGAALKEDEIEKTVLLNE